MADRMDTCASCRFYQSAPEYRQPMNGTCHRRAPVLDRAHAPISMRGEWPMTAPSPNYPVDTTLARGSVPVTGRTKPKETVEKQPMASDGAVGLCSNMDATLLPGIEITPEMETAGARLLTDLAPDIADGHLSPRNAVHQVLAAIFGVATSASPARTLEITPEMMAPLYWQVGPIGPDDPQRDYDNLIPPVFATMLLASKDPALKQFSTVSYKGVVFAVRPPPGEE